MLINTAFAITTSIAINSCCPSGHGPTWYTSTNGVKLFHKCSNQEAQSNMKETWHGSTDPEGKAHGFGVLSRVYEDGQQWTMLYTNYNHGVIDFKERHWKYTKNGDSLATKPSLSSYRSFVDPLFSQVGQSLLSEPLVC